MIFPYESLPSVRRDHLQNGESGAWCRFAIPPGQAQPGSRFSMAATIALDPGASIGSHVHESNEEIYYVISGHGQFEDDGTIHPVGPGDLLLTLQSHRHALRNDGHEPLVILAVIAQ